MAEAMDVIKEKCYLATSEADLIPFLEDSRKGVQKLIEQTKKRFENEKRQLTQLETMKFHEKEGYAKGYQWIAGVDEVGRGPLAGPVVAAAVILPESFAILGVNDSKKLSENQREKLFDLISDCAVSIGIGIIANEIIDQVNIYEATKLAMNEALAQLSPQPDFTLIDAMPLHYSDCELSLIKGDSKSVSIAAASIIAKVTRDRLMKQYDQLYPGYEFARNMGYGTKKHLEGLQMFGSCPIHRYSFEPVKSHFMKI
ncbi:ribonuclease HII [Listeria sp. PSOL-1]|uniref:ribonuclease HII n=1 Tax=Listeria sp. PSOL-1 TaxID=1844999 RepID=UPI0013D37F6B|nr:ribonuclease HII [Listeria sp. PSOL-1]